MYGELDRCTPLSLEDQASLVSRSWDKRSRDKKVLDGDATVNNRFRHDQSFRLRDLTMAECVLLTAGGLLAVMAIYFIANGI